MDERVLIGRLVYDFLERRFAGELVSSAQILEKHPSLRDLAFALKEALLAHQDYLNRTIADYELRGIIGRGGFGEVYRARNRQDGNPCALKIVSKQHVREAEGNQELAGIREYRARVGRHPHLAPILHVGEAGKRYFFYTMDLADNVLEDRKIYRPKTVASCLGEAGGADYQRRRSLRKLPIEDVCDIGCAVASGLKALHSNNLVHCDVKPGNVLCIGHVWHLGDVGLLKSLKKPIGDSGTQLYWPPEGPKQDPVKADLYALGLTLLQCMMGLDVKRARDIVESREHPPLLEPAASMFKIILQACARDATARFRSAAGMYAELDRLLKGLPELSKRSNSSALSRVMRSFLSWFKKGQPTGMNTP